ncbi:putative ABC multidrug transporter [Mollisia scopiformis]|uniref:Putative ABC multidrug transporter n=1 Tax=Mollisia scopiformis TaxID=149040 RepID=A0A194XTU3_MOLSC|nr:putative ABC multidrug transporter [Mollisia scopiformis]KUJ23459.1 putative ABC multidrug transporter [Mollisia scopiformis]
MMPFSTCNNDHSFGPAVLGCRDDFDFTIEFEQLFFSIIPSVIFIVLSIWRIAVLSRRPVIANATPALLLAKLGTIITYTGTNLALLIWAAKRSLIVTDLAIAASTLRLATGVCMIGLSFLDHRRSLKPSMLLNTYLFITTLLDIAQVRTSWLASAFRQDRVFSAIFTSSVVTKAIILILEAQRKMNPEEISGLYNLGVYFWLNSLFLNGYRNVLRIGDLFPLDQALCGSTLQERLSIHLSYSKLQGDKYGLLKVLARTFAVPLLLPIPARLALLGFTFCQPFFISSLLSYLSAPEGSRPVNIGYGFIGASILIYGGIAISTSFYWYFHLRMLYMVRSALVSAIYQKTTERRLAAGDDMASVTLMSTDVERINLAFRNLHEFWANTIEVGLASWLLYLQLGPAFAVPIVTVLCCAAVLTFLVRYVGRAQRAWMGMVQKRVGLTATVIATMKDVKISGLATTVSDLVRKLRMDELKAGAMSRRLSLTSAIIAWVPLMVSPFVTFAIAHRQMDAQKLFTSLSYLLLLSNPLTQVFQSIPQVVAGLACLGRIQDFLESSNHEDFRVIPGKVLNDNTGAALLQGEKDVSAEAGDVSAITVKDGQFGWEQGNMVLHNINIKIPQSKLTLVVGHIASGKSTLCKALLGEIPYQHGQVTLVNRFARIGYCDQTPRLSNVSIKDNIVGFSPFDPERYAEVVDATMLKADFETLSHGENSNIGSNGITLSGGQRQRVSLARALYLQMDLLVLDDILSGLDADTEDQVFRRVFGIDGLVRRRGATAVFCTHSVRSLPHADHIIALGANGTVIEQGGFEELLANKDYIHSLGINGSDDAKERRGEDLAQTIMTTNPSPFTPAGKNDDKSRQTGDFMVYKHYLRSMGLVAGSSLFLLGTLLGFFYNFATIWLKYWSDNAFSSSSAHSYDFYVGIYALLQISFLLTFGALGWVLLVVTMKRSGAYLHRDALRTLMHAPLQFFTRTDQGVITNLFSQHLNLVDTELLTALLTLLYTVFLTIGQAAVLLTSSPYIAISYPFLAVLLYIVQKFYLRTSRQLRLLDLEAKSPLYTHFLDTVKGLLTMRAFGFVAEERAKNIQLLDTSQRPAYLLIMIQQWLTLVLNMVVMIMAVILTTQAVRLRSNSGFAGASFVTLMQFGENLSGIVMFYTMLETSLGAVSRLRNFSLNIIPEDKPEIEDIEPPEDWPQKGKIEIKSISASYGDNYPDSTMPVLALRNINLTFHPGEKIAICGRTGSGKSSLIALLLKLLDPLSSEDNNAFVNIDDTPLHRINRATLRQRIIAVPQDAVFLPDGSSFKANLDPMTTDATSSAADYESVLRIVDLWELVEERGGLDAGMTPTTLSQGQRQLFSLARAVLRKRLRARGKGGGVLLLDEFSSSVDRETERAMREVIRVEFREYTVVAVSHRLDMIMDFDTVVVMDKGEVIEVGNPRQMAANEGTKFQELWSLGSG